MLQGVCNGAYILQLVSFLQQHFERLIAYIAEMPTKMYTIIAMPLPAPNIASTALKWARPTRPQFKPPMTNKIQAIISKTFIHVPFSTRVKKNIPGYNL